MRKTSIASCTIGILLLIASAVTTSGCYVGAQIENLPNMGASVTPSAEPVAAPLPPTINATDAGCSGEQIAIIESNRDWRLQELEGQIKALKLDIAELEDMIVELTKTHGTSNEPDIDEELDAMWTQAQATWNNILDQIEAEENTE